MTAALPAYEALLLISTMQNSLRSFARRSSQLIFLLVGNIFIPRWLWVMWLCFEVTLRLNSAEAVVLTQRVWISLLAGVSKPDKSLPYLSSALGRTPLLM